MALGNMAHNPLQTYVKVHVAVRSILPSYYMRKWETGNTDTYLAEVQVAESQGTKRDQAAEIERRARERSCYVAIHGATESWQIIPIPYVKQNDEPPRNNATVLPTSSCRNRVKKAAKKSYTSSCRNRVKKSHPFHQRQQQQQQDPLHGQWSTIIAQHKQQRSPQCVWASRKLSGRIRPITP